MAQPIWITPEGSLGVIPENVFYQQTLLAEVVPQVSGIIVSATTATTNLITCSSTAGVVVGQVVEFAGTNFGGLEENTRYYVLSVASSTTFTIAATSDSVVPITLTTATGYMIAAFFQRIYFRFIAGTLPQGVQVSSSGLVTGVPQAVANLSGVPIEVASDVTSKFVIRAYTLNGTTIDRISDRTFTLTITGNDVPEFVTPAGSIGTYYDGDLVNIQIQYTGTDPNETILIRRVAGTLPLGTEISSTGLISGYIQPYPNENELVGYDLTPVSTTPYDFIVSAISKNYQFTLEITDGSSSNLRTFTIFVYNRNDLTGDNTTVTADTTFVTADETTERAPFLLNANPSDLGSIRGDNYYAYRFIGQDYDTELVEYVISVNQGTGLPPGLELDPYSGWYYGFIPDQGVTEIEYSFNIQVRARTLVCTNTEFGTNLITADTAIRADVYIGALIIFEGTTFGGITAGTEYVVTSIVGSTQFTIATNTIPQVPVPLSTATGNMYGVPADLPASQQYPFTLTVTGAIDQEVVWLTDSNLGSIENGAVSILKIEAVNRGSRQLYYRLGSGDFNELPQGLQLLPTGEIAGRVSFNTFAIDLGTTTFDASQSSVSGIQETTFDSTFTFTANAYAIDPTQLIYEVERITVVDGGIGYTGGNTTPVIAISPPVGSASSQAEVGSITVYAGAITAVDVADPGSGYTSPATVSVTQGYGGSGAELDAVMKLTGAKEIISVFKTFTIKLIRAYNKPYQNLFVLAMPPVNDRNLLNELLTNQEIFVPEYIYRPDDVNFGLSKRVKYQHAFGLAPDSLETYVSSLYLNHYWKNLVLGEIATAQALDPVTGAVVYEVVYSKVIDNLVNSAGDSVSKDVNLPYPITLDDGSVVADVYPNSLVNMRDQVINVVGQISTTLPLWMTSKQTNGRVLGFTPAWVVAYTNPGRSAQIAYYLNIYFGTQLNQVDFKVDRYELDATLSRNWDTTTQDWTPQPSLTTFDRINTTGYTDLGLVSAATELAFSDVNNRTVEYINNLGGLDGLTWISVAGETPPDNAKVIISNGSEIIFVKQENYNAPINDVDEAWSDFLVPYDESGFDSASTLASLGTFDYAPLILGGLTTECTETTASTDVIKCLSTISMAVGDKVYFTGVTFGNIESETGLGLTKPYYVNSISGITCTATTASTDKITCSSTAGLSDGDEIWFTGTTFGNVSNVLANGQARPYYVLGTPTATQFQISDSLGGLPVALSNDTGSMTVNYGGFTVSDTLGGTVFALASDTGLMTVNYGNLRMSIYEVHINVYGVITLTESAQTIANDYVTSTQGAKYTTGTYLYRPEIPQKSLNRINWQPLITATTVVSSETIFDHGSLQFIEPVDMYDPTDQYDKYLVFPKTNILV